MKNFNHLLTSGELHHLILIFSISTLTMAFALTPSTVIAILAGYFFGWKGLVAILITYPIASVIGLLFGKFLNKLIVGKILAEHEPLKNFFSKLRKHELLLVISSRLSPVLPFAMMNVALATMHLSWARYIIGSMIGMLPRTLVFFYAAMNATEIWSFLESPTLTGFLKTIPILLIFVSLIGLLIVLQRTIRDIQNEIVKD